MFLRTVFITVLYGGGVLNNYIILSFSIYNILLIDVGDIMNLLVSFDIKFKINKENLLKILRHYGFNRIQESLYFAEIKNNQFNNICDEIMENIKESDSIIIIPLCKSCYGKLNLFGNIKFEDDLYRIF